MKPIIFFVILIFYFAPRAFSQLHLTESHKVQTQLKIGDKVPDLVIAKFINGPHTGMNLSDMYKGGGLIINFWATWCVPCVKELPVINALAGEFSNNLKVLSVAYEDSSKVLSFLSKHRDIDLSHVFMITMIPCWLNILSIMQFHIIFG